MGDSCMGRPCSGGRSGGSAATMRKPYQLSGRRGMLLAPARPCRARVPAADESARLRHRVPTLRLRARAMTTDGTMIRNVQALRAYAALWVAWYHTLQPVITGAYGLKTTGTPLLHGAGEVGWIGVDVFFVISGFIMAHCTREVRGGKADACDFMWKRVKRVVPLYWLLTTVVVALALALPHFFNSYRFELVHAIKSYLFIPAAPPRRDGAAAAGARLDAQLRDVFLFRVRAAAVGRHAPHAARVRPRLCGQRGDRTGAPVACALAYELGRIPGHFAAAARVFWRRADRAHDTARAAARLGAGRHDVVRRRPAPPLVHGHPAGQRSAAPRGRAVSRARARRAGHAARGRRGAAGIALDFSAAGVAAGRRLVLDLPHALFHTGPLREAVRGGGTRARERQPVRRRVPDADPHGRRRVLSLRRDAHAERRGRSVRRRPARRGAPPSRYCCRERASAR